MKDIRRSKNPSNQNKHLYRCVTVNFECGWNIPCDYFIIRRSYQRENIKHFSKTKLTDHAQIGIQIIDENAKEIFEALDMTDYVWRGIFSYSIDQSAIHTAYDKAVSK